MTIVDSLMVSVYGITVVFMVLVGLSFLVMLQSKILSSIANANKKADNKEVTEAIEKRAEVPQAESNATCGELKLIGVDERTAAMIMAIVSDESKIPLSELQFKKIKLVD